MCGHATTNATMHTMMAPLDRTGTPAEMTETTYVIVVGIRDVLSIEGITAVIMKVTKVIGLTMAVLLLNVG